MNEQAAGAQPGWSTAALLLAAEEAVRSNYAEIEPVHLLIALCRLADMQAQGENGEEGKDRRQLRAELEALGIQPQQFRRRLRGLAPDGGRTHAVDVFQRTLKDRGDARLGVLSGVACSAASRSAVSRAGELAGNGRMPASRHLLRALLVGDMSGAAEPTKSPGLPDGLPERL